MAHFVDSPAAPPEIRNQQVRSSSLLAGSRNLSKIDQIKRILNAAFRRVAYRGAYPLANAAPCDNSGTSTGPLAASNSPHGGRPHTDSPAHTSDTPPVWTVPHVESPCLRDRGHALAQDERASMLDPTCGSSGRNRPTMQARQNVGRELADIRPSKRAGRTLRNETASGRLGSFAEPFVNILPNFRPSTVDKLPRLTDDLDTARRTADLTRRLRGCGWV